MADRLISADALDNALTELRFNADGELAHWGDRKDWCLHGNEIEKLIADAPTVDAVPVVRCKDCIHFWDGVCKAHIDVIYVDDNDFCSMGERNNETG